MSMIKTEPGTEGVEIRDPLGRKLLYYDWNSRRVILHLPAGDLEVRSRDGAIELTSDEHIRIRSRGKVEIEGVQGVRVTGGPLQIVVPEVELEAERVTASAGEANFVWGKMEETVGRLFQWAKNLYLRVEDLVHTRAGRIRTEATDAVVVQAQSLRLRAKGDVKIQGETIHLG